MNYSAISNYTSAALAFYKINDVVLNVAKIGKFMPEQKRVRKDRDKTSYALKIFGLFRTINR